MTKTVDKSTDATRYLLTIGDQQFYNTLVKPLCELQAQKSEFQDIELKLIELPATNPDELRASEVAKVLPAKLLLPTFICYCSQAAYPMVANYLHGKYAIPLFVILTDYNTKSIDEVFQRDYLYMRGVVHQATRDPEEIGLIFREIKDEFRRCLAREGRSITKKLRWKIEASADTPTQSRLVSLFLDPVMREFMQRLVFTVESLRVELPTRPEQQKVRQIFERISNKEQTQNAEDEARHLLNREQCLSRFTGKFARPQPLLLEGETGVGKTVIAEWLYRRLARSDRQMSFQRISTVNLGVNFLEAELFGTVAGAWTGSVTRPGKLLLGYGGVVFLDEIGELAPEVQAKFLVYLDTFEFTPDGWPYDWPIWAPSYIVAATNKDLKQAVGAGAFRRDLYHRFTHKLRVPALRERRHDLRPLIDLVLQNPAINNNYVDEISLAALGRLEAYDFPGNFRELEAILARTVFRTRQMGRRVIQEEDVEFNLI